MDVKEGGRWEMAGFLGPFSNPQAILNAKPRCCKAVHFRIP